MQTAKGSHTQTTVSDVTFDNKREGSKPAIILPNRLRPIICKDIYMKVIQLEAVLHII